MTAHLVRAGDEGFAVPREEEKLGLNSSSTADLRFEATPGERLGAPGAGLRIALSTLDGGRIGIAAQAVGIAQAALDLATAYAGERTAFGGPIARFGAIQQKLADMQTEIEAARALTWRAARLKQAGHPHTVEGAQAKLFASGVARRQTGEAIQVLGGYGLHEGVPRRALLPRRQGHRDLRGHERDPAPGDRPGAAGRGRARLMPSRARAARPVKARPPPAYNRAHGHRAARARAGHRRGALVRGALRRDARARGVVHHAVGRDRPPALHARTTCPPTPPRRSGCRASIRFTRGVYPSMYRGRLWTMRQFAGFGTAEETNARFRYLLDHGQTGLSTAFDMPSLMGLRLRPPARRWARSAARASRSTRSTTWRRCSAASTSARSASR